MPDVAGDAMGPAIVDRNAIAGGALGFRFRAGWALFIDLFLKLLDLAEVHGWRLIHPERAFRSN